jgi:hypothetical protein
MLAGEEVSVKSPSATGLEAPPHDSNIKQRRRLEHRTAVFEIMPMSPPKTLA